jgi:hypothetical protein
MPQPIAESERAPAIIKRQYIAVLIEIEMSLISMLSRRWSSLVMLLAVLSSICRGFW